MNRLEMVREIYERLDRRTTTRDVERVLEAFEAIVTAELVAGHRVQLIGFGTFKTNERAPRVGVNPRRPSERVEVGARRVAKFIPGERLKRCVAGR